MLWQIAPMGRGNEQEGTEATERSVAEDCELGSVPVAEVCDLGSASLTEASDRF